MDLPSTTYFFELSCESRSRKSAPLFQTDTGSLIRLRSRSMGLGDVDSLRAKNDNVGLSGWVTTLILMVRALILVYFC